MYFFNTFPEFLLILYLTQFKFLSPGIQTALTTPSVFVSIRSSIVWLHALWQHHLLSYDFSLPHLHDHAEAFPAMPCECFLFPLFMKSIHPHGLTQMPLLCIFLLFIPPDTINCLSSEIQNILFLLSFILYCIISSYLTYEVLRSWRRDLWHTFLCSTRYWAHCLTQSA